MIGKFEDIEHQIIYNKLNERLGVKVKPDELSNITHDSSQYLKEIDGYINSMLQTRENLAYRYLHSHRKLIGPLVVFVKKVVRKLLKWYIEPVTFQQTRFNNAVTPAIGRTTELISELIQKTNNMSQNLNVHQVQYESLAERITQEQNQQSILLENYEQISQIQLLQQKEQQEQQNSLLSIIEQMRLEYEKKITALEKRLEYHDEYIEQTNKITNKLTEVGLINDVSENFFIKKTYAQSGEDSILAYIVHVLGIPFEEVSYIDLGANHAKELSNTYYFYNKGAKGVLVEANPYLIPELKFYRHGDVILNNCVDIETGKEIDFYILNGDGLSTPSLEAAASFCEINPNLTIIDKKTVQTISYSSIVEQYLGKAPTILSIDIEGNELEVLKSINYEISRPLIIVAEMVSYATKLSHNTKGIEIKELLEDKDYDEYAFTGINSIYLDRRFLKEREK